MSSRGSQNVHVPRLGGEALLDPLVARQGTRILVMGYEEERRGGMRLHAYVYSVDGAGSGAPRVQHVFTGRFLARALPEPAARVLVSDTVVGAVGDDGVVRMALYRVTKSGMQHVVVWCADTGTGAEALRELEVPIPEGCSPLEEYGRVFVSLESNDDSIGRLQAQFVPLEAGAAKLSARAIPLLSLELSWVPGAAYQARALEVAEVPEWPWSDQARWLPADDRQELRRALALNPTFASWLLESRWEVTAAAGDLSASVFLLGVVPPGTRPFMDHHKGTEEESQTVWVLSERGSYAMPCVGVPPVPGFSWK